VAARASVRRSGQRVEIDEYEFRELIIRRGRGRNIVPQDRAAMGARGEEKRWTGTRSGMPIHPVRDRIRSAASTSA